MAVAALDLLRNFEGRISWRCEGDDHVDCQKARGLYLLTVPIVGETFAQYVTENDPIPLPQIVPMTLQLECACGCHRPKH